MLGTLVNTGAVIVGSLVGMAIHSRLPQRYVNIVFQGIGLITIGIGVSMSLKSGNILLAVISVVAGAVIGEWLGIDRGLEKFSHLLQRKAGGKNADLPDPAETAVDDTPAAERKTASSRFTEGFITASMLFCVGSMSILGAIEDGTGQTPNLFFTKSIMDGMSSIILASSFGIAILFSSASVLVYQGGLTLLAGFLMHYMSDAMVADMTAVGGLMLVGLGLNILKIKSINVVNMLPALVVAVLLSYLWPA
jgi:uncharacterized membrane protein YqgA involved in biofilm formation